MGEYFSVMIAAYTITCLLDMLSREGTKTTVKAFASVSIVVTLVAVIGILGAGSRMGNSLPY